MSKSSSQSERGRSAGRLALHGYRIEHLAELVRMSNAYLYRELCSIGESHPDALVGRSQDVTDQVDTLADLLCETAEKIRADADAWENMIAAAGRGDP